jgi:hypothetical protein
LVSDYANPSGRPFPVAKLSELYLLAAEAALQNNDPTDATTLLNVLRKRAAYRASYNAGQLSNAINAMTITQSQVTLDFIMDERTRELCGESQRWPDLAMRGMLVARVQADNPDGAANVKPFHVLRPIPQGELNAINDANKAQYQNPGY